MNNLSNCCSSPILNEHNGEGVCSDCKEPCVVQQEETSDSDMWASIKEDRQKQHAEWKAINTADIIKSRIPYRWAGNETMLFREPGRPKVDFYPSTGRWRVAGGRTYRGGANAFLRWYLK